MGFMTLEGFRRELFQHLGERSPSDNLILNNWVNRAYFEVVGIEEFEALKRSATATVGKEVRSVTFPDSFLSVMSVADLTNKRRLLQIELRNFQLKDRDSLGSPKLWARRASTIFFWPTPSKSFQVELYYIVEPDPLTLDSDTTGLPGAWDQAIVLLTLRNAFLTIQEDERATLAYQSAMAYIRSLQAERSLDSGQPALGIDVARSESDLTDMRTS
jgi:hypothetical protein